MLDLLCIMSMNDVKSQVTVRDARGLPPIMKLLDDPEVEIRRRAARTLGAVAQNNRTSCATNRALGLSHSLTRSHWPLYGETGKIQQEVRKAKDVVKRVVDMMRDPNEEVKKAAAGAAAALAENDCTLSFWCRICRGAFAYSLARTLLQSPDANQVLIRKYDAVKTLVDILSSDSREDVKEQAAAAVRSMAKGNTKIQQDFREGPCANGIPVLVHLLSATSVGLRIHVTGALMELARDNSTRLAHSRRLAHSGD